MLLYDRGFDRQASARYGGYIVGVLVQTNFGGLLTMSGVPVGQRLGQSEYGSADGSCMIIVATGAPLTARDLKRLTARAVFGLARTGSSYSHGSGGYAIAFSTAASVRVKPGTQRIVACEILPTEQISPLLDTKSHSNNDKCRS